MNAPQTSVKPELLRQVTVSNCGWKQTNIMARLLKKAAVVNQDTGEVISEAEYNDQVPLVRITGIVNKAKPGAKTIGDRISEWLTLSGEFTAVNLGNQKVFIGSKAIVSDVVSGPIAAALASGVSSAEFAVEIGAKYSAKSVTGYEFYTKTLMEVQQTSRMQQLLALAMSDAPLALENGAGDAGANSAKVAETGETAAPAAAVAPSGKTAKTK